MKEKELERTLKALANKRRFTILRFLKKKKEASVGEIAHAINLSFRATSKHLGILSMADLVEYEQRSLQIYYWLSKEQNKIVKALLSVL